MDSEDKKLSRALLRAVPYIMLAESVLLMLLGSIPAEAADGKRTVSNILAFFFWLTFVGAYAALGMSTGLCRSGIKAMLADYPQRKRLRRRVALLNFFSPGPAKYTDLVFIGTAVVFIITLIISGLNIAFVETQPFYIIFSVVLSVFLLMFNLHIFLNSSVYSYIRGNKGGYSK